MVNIGKLKFMLSKLRQQRYYLEKSCEKMGKMLPVCVIFRRRRRGTRDFQPIKEEGKSVKQEGCKIYSYMTYFEEGITRHHYIRREELDNVLPKAEEYRHFCKNMAQIRYLNKRIVGLLDKTGEIQMEEVKSHVKKRMGQKKSKGKGKKKDGKEE